jgi:uncharacterized protein with HEPN domain
VSRRDDERVADILEAASETSAVTELGRDAWDKDRIRQLAVERLLEIIGEAANSLGEEFRTQHPATPWRDIIGHPRRDPCATKARLPSSAARLAVGSTLSGQHDLVVAV